MLFPILLLLLLPLLLPATAEDAYTACACVRRRLMRRPCPAFVRHAAPSCAPGVEWHHCERLCCESCLVHADTWPVCRSAALRSRCDRYADTPPDTPDSSDDESSEYEHDHRRRPDVVGPKMQTDSHPPTPWMTDPEHSPDMYLDDEEALPLPSTAPDSSMEPSPDAALSPSEGPYDYYTPEAEATPEARGAEARVDPPFDATNEGELDLAPADGRPFAPAACECMSREARCDPVLAAASGVCRPHARALEQGPDCHFACCRICTVNRLATYCDDAPIVQACRL